ncbi:sigma-70 family RNA polymerase sigma factor [Roseibacillus ishigakijimensis]|uniref:Sigma-70 family RNA polymerase sigma factor n=1 Tax=Roseibacillus ishigakijimensis TaxID=454146 RepID=A0A934VL02_9BACT|nr:sigma-70 family RNA polymerase sigma factor [Roseibacillus ishigakijimensis]MBK1832712.1 sigma-70 family RNA polymerase sigma factor [Roseibacillus ishigakijimensis]
MSVAENDTSLHWFDDEIKTVQTRLKSYLQSSLGNRSDAEDVLQETNLVLWRKREDFERGTSFWAWAQRVAFFQLMAFRKKRSRSRLVLDDEVVHLLAVEAPEVFAGQRDPREKSLQACLASLPERQRELITRHYFQRESLKTLASAHSSSVAAIGQTLYRARHNLQLCLQKKNPNSSES